MSCAWFHGCSMWEELQAQFSIMHTLAYSSEIAPTGHVPAQEPQLIQVSGLISNFPSPSEIAPTGQPPAQEPQEIHESEITNAIIAFLLILYNAKAILIHFCVYDKC